MVVVTKIKQKFISLILEEKKSVKVKMTNILKILNTSSPKFRF